jgi:hypothetical protein
VSKKDRRDDGRRGDRRDSQPEDDQQRRTGDIDVQEGDSLTALKAILGKVARLLKPLQLTQDESIRLVEELYGKVLETDLQLAGEADDTRKSSVLAAIQNATIRREGGKIVVDYSTAPAETPGAEAPAVGTPGSAGAAPGAAGAAPVEAAAPEAPAWESAPAAPQAEPPRVEPVLGEVLPFEPASLDGGPVGPAPADAARRKPAPRRTAPRRPAPARDDSPKGYSTGFPED